ncbi:hypothetical protein DFJ74DRAFT_517652 [Hyaloraphidium curvatum]|nr:hypothetical protein DFJ74DRAFT_517652 [Hyaloraphidium curvatum]
MAPAFSPARPRTGLARLFQRSERPKEPGNPGGPRDYAGEEDARARDWFAARGLLDDPHSAAGEGPLGEMDEIEIASLNSAQRGSAWCFAGVVERCRDAASNGEVTCLQDDADVPPEAQGTLPCHVLRFPRSRFRDDQPVANRSVVASRPLQPPFPRERGLHYFEVTVLEMLPAHSFYVGLVVPPFPDFRMPGWHANSIGFGSREGSLFFGDRHGPVPYISGFRKGQTIGCGALLADEGGALGFFFTKDGRLMHPSGFGTVHQPLDALIELPPCAQPLLRKLVHACVGTNGPAKLACNFGERPFAWDRANDNAVVARTDSGCWADDPRAGSLMIVWCG